MGKTLKINTVCECNDLLGKTTLNPLVSVIDLSKTDVTGCDTLKANFYTVLLKEYKCGHSAFGRMDCDYSDGTVLFLTPGETFKVEEKQTEKPPSKGWLLAFHPDLMRNGYMERQIQQYSFFSYYKNEALHISFREKKIFLQHLENINEELHRSIDRHSRTLVAKTIELLLDYCKRFYERQFICRCLENKRLVSDVDRIIDDYFKTNNVETFGLPSLDYCSKQLDLSSSYFGDLLQHETGSTFEEYLRCRRIEIAKNWLLKTNKTPLQVSFELGFSSSKYFNSIFKHLTGYLPEEYKPSNN